MEIQVLGAHNCESKKTRFPCLLVDGVMALDAGGLTSGLSFAAQQKIRAVLLTHPHYDHIRDIPAVGMNALLGGYSVGIYGVPAVHDMLVSHLCDGKIYPNFFERPQDKPALRFTAVEPGKTVQIEGYGVLPVEVNHPIPNAGYEITSAAGKVVFYTGDTGPGLSNCWEKVSPQLLIVEVSASNGHEEGARKVGHITPGMLKQELVDFQKMKGYIPEVVAVHITPSMEKEIAGEIAAVARELGASLRLGHEGMKLIL